MNKRRLGRRWEEVGGGGRRWEEVVSALVAHKHQASVVLL